MILHEPDDESGCARTSRAEIIAALRNLLEDGGIGAVSMAGVAEWMGSSLLAVQALRRSERASCCCRD